MSYFHTYDVTQMSEGVTELTLTGPVGGVGGAVMGVFSKNRMRRDLRDELAPSRKPPNQARTGDTDDRTSRAAGPAKRTLTRENRVVPSSRWGPPPPPPPVARARSDMPAGGAFGKYDLSARKMSLSGPGDVGTDREVFDPNSLHRGWDKSQPPPPWFFRESVPYGPRAAAHGNGAERVRGRAPSPTAPTRRGSL